MAAVDDSFSTLDTVPDTIIASLTPSTAATKVCDTISPLVKCAFAVTATVKVV